MPSWDEIINEIQQTNPYTVVRRKYISKLHEETHRNIICYYSGFLSKTVGQLSIADEDMTGFMTAVKDMDTSLGLDLVLHTPGGNPTATEAIVKYLRSKFGIDIRVIVPQIAMSAGTMIACAGKEIVMGKQSSLGPIDPQIIGMAAFNIKKVFLDAQEALRVNPQDTAYWAIQLQKYPPSLIYDCVNAISLSSELVENWLIEGMFYGDPTAEEKARTVVSNLNQNEDSKTHGRHFDKELCKSYGLKIVDLEDDGNILQDAVLSVHHAYMAVLSNTSTVKIIENQMGKMYALQQNIPPTT